METLFIMILPMAFLAALLWWIIGVFKPTGKISETGSMICPSCGTRGEPKQLTRGNIAIEIVLWICFIVPGLIYSIWRMSTKYPVCPACTQPGMIGVNTPNGKLMLAKFQAAS